MTDDVLYFCEQCTVVTVADVDECPACGHEGDRRTLAIIPPEVDT